MGNSSRGSSSSRLRVRMESAAKKVPFTTRAQVPSGKTTARSQALADRVQIVKDGKDRSQNDLDRRRRR